MDDNVVAEARSVFEQRLSMMETRHSGASSLENVCAMAADGYASDTSEVMADHNGDDTGYDTDHSVCIDWEEEEVAVEVVDGTFERVPLASECCAITVQKLMFSEFLPKLLILRMCLDNLNFRRCQLI
jgi:hypothetical protein